MAMPAHIQHQGLKSRVASVGQNIRELGVNQRSFPELGYGAVDRHCGAG